MHHSNFALGHGPKLRIPAAAMEHAAAGPMEKAMAAATEHAVAGPME